MALFEYQAIEASGKKVKASIEAETLDAAKSIIKQRGLMITHIQQRVKRVGKSGLSGEALLTFTLQLSQLINAGVPLYESLVAIEEQSKNESYHRIILSISEQIKGGTSLSEAMQKYPEAFNSLYCSMIAAGEAAGALGLVLDRLSQLLGKQTKLKNEIKTAMIYPAILACFSLLIIGVLLGFVVPSIEGIFEGRELNWFTNLVLNISFYFRSYWWVYLPISIIALIWGWLRLRSPKGQEWLQRASLSTPALGKLVVQTSIARFSRTMATLLQGGLTLTEALPLARKVMRNVKLEEIIANAEEKIIEGSHLSTELKQSSFIPPLVSRMIAVGEDTGKSFTMFEKIADMYEEELEKSLGQLVALAQPAILIVMGGIIGMVMIAILLPLTDVASFAG